MMYIYGVAQDLPWSEGSFWLWSGSVSNFSVMYALSKPLFFCTPLLFARGLWWWFLCFGSLGQQIVKVGNQFKVMCLAVQPNDPEVFLCGGYSAEVKAWDARTCKVSCISSLQHRRPIPVRPGFKLYLFSLKYFRNGNNRWGLHFWDYSIWHSRQALSNTQFDICSQVWSLAVAVRHRESSELTALSRHANLHCGALHPFWLEFRLACSQLPSH